MNDLSTQIMTEEIWLTLGYESFTEMFEREGMNDLVLAPPARRSAIKAIMEESPGISNRKVAEILGVGSRTIDRDIPMIATASHDAPNLPEIKPLRPNPKPKAITPTKPPVEEIVDAEIVEERKPIHDCPSCNCKPA